MFIISVTIFASRILKKKENIPQTTIKNEVVNIITLDFSGFIEKVHIYNHFQEYIVRIVAGIQGNELNKK